MARSFIAITTPTALIPEGSAYRRLNAIGTDSRASRFTCSSESRKRVISPSVVLMLRRTVPASGSVRNTKAGRSWSSVIFGELEMLAGAVGGAMISLRLELNLPVNDADFNDVNGTTVAALVLEAALGDRHPFVVSDVVVAGFGHAFAPLNHAPQSWQ